MLTEVLLWSKLSIYLFLIDYTAFNYEVELPFLFYHEGRSDRD